MRGVDLQIFEPVDWLETFRADRSLTLGARDEGARRRTERKWRHSVALAHTLVRA